MGISKINVETSSPYIVYIGKGLLRETGPMLKNLLGRKYKKAAVITDDNVAPLYLKTVRQSLESAGLEALEYIIPHGESSKNIDMAMNICGFLSENYFTRGDVIVALGGGVVGDLAGFVASVYQRGADFIQLPTTFLAAIDSSVGGKTAVNIPQGKNLVGCFHQPSLVLCDTDTLDTLDAETFADGVAEAVKYGCIWDAELFEKLKRAGKDIRQNIGEIITRCVQIKADVVKLDETDNALRRILNFGHTAGHALEKLSRYEMTHGKAVAVGMVVAAKTGESLGITEAGTAQKLVAVLEANDLPINPIYPVADICAACLGDKKREGSTINFILLEKIGKSVIVPFEAEKLGEVLIV